MESIKYYLYPNVNETEGIVLFSHIEPSEEIKSYLNYIKNFINLPFSYIHFDIKQVEIISEI